ncbi:electron transfer flavoprotein subunit beta/FixA family protein [Proteiniclasticum sp. BAD-10]|uniref:Electron transfer flavoprotein small subunit n=1 Tax=Proteiniclasticum sediminis TaxID=2804028 RepID=A0A941CTE4_9CLOT|nr:electron transfer flavoprotein subunit beta/FixA family protein [Proteiniclasticum sediminis]MBR0577388.1 electron transfer flavoprotein subunit beta/FixA family protein [Proteiniclasticum sediminis]
MKIICMVKYVPDVDKFQFDFDKNVVIRHNIRMILNPEDAKAVGLALEIKRKDPSTFVEVLCMGPKSVLPMINDLARIGVDRVTLLSDHLFVGSDSYITSKILGMYLSRQRFDLILTGNHSIDGDTSHVPSQVADLLGLPQMGKVVSVMTDNISRANLCFISENDSAKITFTMDLPGVLSISKESAYKLPYLRYEDTQRSIEDKITILTGEDLGITKSEVGIAGSLTKVKRTFVKEYKKRAQQIVQVDDAGIDKTYEFLRSHGYLGGVHDE